MVNQRDDGGPAFPFEIPAGGGCGPTTYFGMTLRDYFAAKAMAVMLTGAVGKIGNDPNIYAYATGPCNAVIVDRAYTIADAMLEARK